MKRFVIILSLALFGASAASAGTGKVESVSDGQVVVEMKEPGRLKKGNSVKLEGKTGNITAVNGNRFTIRVKNIQLKPGDTVSVEKGSDMQGC